MLLSWSTLWKMYLLCTPRIVLTKASFWDEIADIEEESKHQVSELTVKQLRKIPVDPESTVLEIGPGTGRLTIPLAKAARKVTVVESSREMISHLMANAKRNQVDNIVFVNKRWEEVVVGKDLEVHDIVIASFSLFMVNIEEALAKMNEAAKRAVYLAVSAECWIPGWIQRILYGEELFKGFSDHLLIFSILHEMGIHANVEVISYEHRKRYDDLEKAVSHFAEIYGVPSDKKSELKVHLRGILVEKDGKLWHLQKKRAALIWWVKET